jgi:hypothetical protein
MSLYGALSLIFICVGVWFIIGGVWMLSMSTMKGEEGLDGHSMLSDGGGDGKLGVVGNIEDANECCHGTACDMRADTSCLHQHHDGDYQHYSAHNDSDFSIEDNNGDHGDGSYMHMSVDGERLLLEAEEMLMAAAEEKRKLGRVESVSF